MDIKKNFQTAVKELLKGPEDKSKANINDENIYREKSGDEVLKDLINGDAHMTNDNQYGENGDKRVTPQEYAGDNMQTSVICSDTVVSGNITTSGHISMAGNMQGSIEAKGKVKISGKIIGNISGDSIELSSSVVKGDSTAAKGVVINTDAYVVGDITSRELTIDGKLKGNINVESGVTLNAHALIIGNIKAQAISIESGAVLRGTLEIQNTNQEDIDFEHIIGE